jgi:crotonobetainyl-CoA:carnitine CoA-transferase CaiB-like acyl-CoA transferase
MYATQAILAALLRRELTGEGGQKIDVSLLDGQVAWMTYMASSYFATGDPPDRMGSKHPTIAPYQAFETRDGYVVVAVGSESLWPGFCRAIDREDLIDDDRFRSNRDRVEHREKLNDILNDEFKKKTRQEWIEAYEDQRLPVGPVRTIEEALTSDITAQNGIRSTVEHPAYGSLSTLNLPVKINGERQEFTSPPPVVGENSREVLLEMGLSEAEIDELADKGII